MPMVLEENVGTQFSNIPGVVQERETFYAALALLWTLSCVEQMAQGTGKELKEACLNVQGDSAVEFFSEGVSEWAEVGESFGNPV